MTRQPDGSQAREDAQLTSQSAAQLAQLCARQQAEIIRLQGDNKLATMALKALDQEVTKLKAVLLAHEFAWDGYHWTRQPATSQPISLAEELARR